jgi:hypothetical protein
MTEPYEKSYELPIGEPITEQEVQEEYERGIELLERLATEGGEG